jgi:formylglycine-generating enzyme required for sulfatase activity/DNA-binding winged helix-turn-helix (wHTH) protein/dienelactone hydrolase
VPSDLVRFEDVELDAQRYSLRRSGRNLKLERIPMELLLFLVERRGLLVTREEIIEKLWGKDVFLDTDNSINTAIRKIRQALKDDPEQPRFVQTVAGKGYRFIAPIVQPDESAGNGVAGPASRPLRSVAESDRKHPVPPGNSEPTAPTKAARDTRMSRMLVGGIAMVAVLIAIGAMVYRHYARMRWVRERAVPQIQQLVVNRKPVAAYLLFRQAQQMSPDDPSLKRLELLTFWPRQFTTNPPGADVFLRDYNEPKGDFQYLGKTPLQGIRLPHDHYVVQFRKEGYETLESTTAASRVSVDLLPSGSLPLRMVRVSGGQVNLGLGGPVENTVGSRFSQKIDDFFIDKYEVTNREFKKFVDAGGYRNPKYWKQPFVDSGHTLSFEQAISQFRDKTDRPGPSTWELGSFPPGQDDYPVGGVSWYEAAAYAEFVGKSLPTVYHWYEAGFARDILYSDILFHSNFSGKGPAPVGSYSGIGPFGTYDMAGNVKEWCFNASGDRRYILGGGSTDLSYMYEEPDARPPFERFPTHGIRLAKYLQSEALPYGLTAPIPNISRTVDYRKAKPVSDATFRIYQGLYSYDETPLDARIESEDDSAPDWKKERVSFNAAYANERVPAYLFLPKNASPPYQTVVYFPHGAAQIFHSIEDGQFEGVDFLVRAGRAVMFPIYKGSYERQGKIPDAGTIAYREATIEQAKDLRRAVDYLETRQDIDRSRIAYYAVSWGADLGSIMLAVENRIRVAVLVAGACDTEKELPEVDPMNFAPHVTIPTLMMNGKYDFMDPLDTCQEPLFRVLGAPPRDKRHIVFDSGHAVPDVAKMKEALDWLDRYLGPVK